MVLTEKDAATVEQLFGTNLLNHAATFQHAS
jgi:hypothetical protein